MEEKWILASLTGKGLEPLGQDFPKPYLAFREMFERTMNHLNDHPEIVEHGLRMRMNWTYMTQQLPAWKKLWVDHPELNVLKLNVYPKTTTLAGQLEIC